MSRGRKSGARWTPSRATRPSADSGRASGRLLVPVPRATRPVGRRRGLPLLIGAGVAVLVVVLTAVVFFRPVDSDRLGPTGPDPEAVVAAAGFAADVWTLDPNARALAIGRWVVQKQVAGFIGSFTESLAPLVGPGASLTEFPQSYRVAEYDDTVAVVLIWSRMTGTAAPAAAPYEISAFGVTKENGYWQVFAFHGSVAGVPPGDPRLSGFQPLSRTPNGEVRP